MVCFDASGTFPEVQATTKSKLISNLEIDQATPANPNATITVTHNDNSTFTYIIHFANAAQAPTVTLSNNGNYSVCQNGSLTMTASGDAASYSWSNGLGNNATATPPTNTVGPTTYTVTGYSSNGCETTATATVTVNPLPSVTLSSNHDQSVCAGTAIDNIIATIGGGNATASGLPGLSFNNGVISGTPNGTSEYTITVTSTYTPSCGTASASGTITVSPQPVATLSPNTVTACEGAAITPVIATTSGGTVTHTLPAGLTYNSQTGEITGIPEAAGTITITTTSPNNNCGSQTAQCAVTLTPAPNVTLSNNKDQTLCSSSEFTNITVEFSGGSVSVTGLTNTGLSYSNGQNTGQITGNPTTGSHKFFVTVSSTTCGSVTDSGTVVVNPDPTVTLSPSNFSVCKNGSVEGLTVSPFNSTTVVSGLPNGVTFDNTTGQITGTPDTVGTFTITVTTSTNCGNASTTGSITVKPLPSISLSSSNIEVCEGEDINTINVTTTNCSNSTAAILSNGLYFSGLSNNEGTITGAPTTPGNFTVTAISNNQCGNATTEGTVTIKTKPTVSISGPETICQGVATPFTAEGNFTSCQWDNESTDATCSITSNIAGQHTYTVTATDSNGCTNSASKTVTTQSSPATPIATTVNNSSCHAPYNGSITVNSPTGNNLTYSIDGENFQASTQFNGLGASTYTLTVKNAAGCTSSQVFQVGSDGNNVDAQASANSPCEGGTLTLTGSSTTLDATFAWSGPNGFSSTEQSPTINSATTANNGTYTLTVTQPSTGCTNTVPVTVTVKPLPNVHIAETAINPSVCPGTNLHIMVNAQNGSNLSFSAPTLPDNVSLTTSGFIDGTVSTPGTYPYTVTNTSSECGAASVNGTITVYELPTIHIMGDTSFCQGSNTTIWVEDTTYNSYIWNNNNDNFSITVSAAGAYTVTVTDSLGCQNSKTQQVTMNTPAEPEVIVTDNTNCEPFNGTITVTSPVGEGNTYTLEGIATQSSPYFTDLEEDTYILRVTDVNTCQSTLEIEVGSVVSYPQPTHIYDTAINNYTWNNTVYTESGTYPVNFTAANGCDSTVTLHLTIIKSVENEVWDTACESYEWGGETYTTSGVYVDTFNTVSGVDSIVTLHLTINQKTYFSDTQVACDNYTWIDGITYTESGIYVDTLVNAANCDSIVTLNLTINKSDSTTVDSTICANALPLTWNGQEFTEAGTKSVTLSTVNQCDSVVIMTLNVNALPDMSLLTVTNNTSCGEPNGSILVTVAGGADCTYSLNNGDFQSSPVFSNLEEGTYTVTVRNANGCTSSATTTVNNNISAVIATTTANTPCAGGDLMLTAETETTGASFVWSGPDGFTSNEQNPTINNITATQGGEYTVTVTDTVTHCFAIGTVSVSVNTPAVTLATIADKTACAGDNVTLNAALTGTPVGEVTYSWSGPNNFSSDQQNITLNNITAEQGGEYTVVANAMQTVNNVTCLATDTNTVNVTVNAPDAGTLTINGNTTICQGESTELTASVTGSNGEVTYEWNNGTTDATLTATQSGEYTVTATATIGNCTATAEASVNVTVNNPVAGTLTVNGNTTLCQGESTTLTATVNGNNGDVTYAWSNDATSGAITVTPMENTSYTVIATTTVGECTASTSKTVNVVVNALPVVEITGETSFCEGGSSTLTATEGYNYSWNNQSTNQSITATQSGDYTVVVTDDHNCQSTATIHVNVLSLPEVPTLSITNNTSCSNTPNGVISITNSVSGLSYSIDGTNFQTENIFSGLAGNYTITVKNAEGCTNTATANVGTTPLTVDASASANTPCAGGELQLTAASETEGVTFAWSGPNFTSAEQNPTISDASADLNGEYTVIVTDPATQCSAEATINVTVNTPAVTLANIMDKTACAGDNVTLNAALTGTPVGEVTYSWSGPNNFSSDQQNITLNNITAEQGGEYTVVANAMQTVNNVTCLATDTNTVNVTVNAPDAGTITINGDTIFCQGESTELTASVTGSNGDVTYEWNNGSTNATLTATQGGNYTVVATATIGNCSTTTEASVNVTVNNPVAGTVNVSGNTILCQGESTTLTASVSGSNGEVTYAWSNDATGEAITVTPMENSSYTVIATTTVGECTASTSKTVNVIVNALPVVEITGETSFCEGGNSTLTATEGYTYSWNNQSTNQSITATQSGDYTVVVTDDNGCQNTATFTVNVLALPAVPTFTVTDNTSCDEPNGVITVTNAADGLSYSIAGNNFQTATIFNNLNAGTYTLTVQNANGCTNATPVAVNTTDNTVTATATANTPCAGGDLMLTATTETTGATFAWTGPNGYTSNEQNPTINNITSTQGGEYTVTVTDPETHCSMNATVNVAVNTPAVALANIVDKTACAGDNVTLNATLTGTPAGEVSYSWSSPNGFTSDQQNNTLNNITAEQGGTYTVMATATQTVNNTICTATDTKTFNVTVNTPSAGTLTIDGNSTICHGDTTTLTASVTGSNGNVTYEWNNGSTEATFTATQGGEYTVTAIATIGNCTAMTEASVNVTVNNPVAGTLTVNGNTTLCQGESTTLTATVNGNNGDVTYAWSNDATSGAITVTPMENISYTVIATTNVGGCTATATKTVNVTVNALPEVEITGTAEFCQGESTVLTATEGYSYQWGNGSTNQSIDVSQSGIYTVTATNSNNCQKAATFTVNVLALPAVPTFNVTNNTSCDQSNGVISVTNAADGLSYSIDGINFQEEATFNGLDAGQYTVTVKNANGCTNSDTATVNTTGNNVEAEASANTPCAGDTLKLTVTTGTAGATFAWTGQNGFSSTEQNPTLANANADMSGSYTVKVTDPITHCSISKTVTASVNTPAVTLANIADKTACAGDNVTLNATLTGTPAGEVSYSWSGPNGFTSDQQNNTLNNITAEQDGAYTVMATATQTVNNTICTATDTKTVNVTVNAPNAGTVAINGDSTICQGESTELVASTDGSNGDVTYEWNNGSTDATITATQGGDYTVVATATIGNCSVSDEATFNVTVNNPVAGTLTVSGNTMLCQGESTTLTANVSNSNGDVTFAWSNDVTSETITVSESGEYTVTATATIGECTASTSKTVNVTVNSLPVVEITGENSFCQGGNTTLTATGGYTYMWNNQSTNQSISVIQGGDYTVTVTDTNNCQNNTTVTVNVLTLPAAPQLTTTDNTSCEEPNGVITVTNAADGLSYSIDGNYFQTDTTFNAMNAGTYTITVMNADGCTNSAPVTVSTTNNTVDATASANTPCAGETLQLTGASSTTGVTYGWTGPNGFISNEQNPTIAEANANMNGSYTLTVTDPSTHCSMSVMINVTVNQPTTGDTAATACESFDWYDHANITGSGNYTHTISGGNANGCDSIITLHLTINHGTHNVENVTANNSYNWHEQDLTISGTYTFDYVANGCPSTDTLHLTILGSTTTIDNQTACNSFEWIDGVTYTESTSTPTDTLTAANGADSIVVLHLTILKPAVGTLTINGETSICQGESTILTASVAGNNGNMSYAWSNDATSESVTVSESGNLTVTATATLSANGVACTATDNKTVTVTVNQPATGIDEQTACEEFTWNGVTYTASTNEPTVTLEAANGCDSIVTLNLTINHGTHNVETVTANDSYTWHGQSLTVSDTYTFDYVANGCPSTDTLHLTILGSTTTVDNQTACNFFEWIDGVTYTESTNTPTDTLTAANGADSIVVLHLTILKPAVGTLTINGETSICQGESTTLTASVAGNNGNMSYAWSNDATSESVTVSESGNLTVTATATLTANGVTCTTTDNKTVTVTVNQPATGIDVQTACEEFTWINNVTYYENNNTATVTLPNAAANGCDSIVTLNLTINHGTHNVENVTANNSYNWHGQDLTISNTYTFDYTNAAGCASTDTLHLTILGSTTTVDEQAACEEFTWINNITYYESTNTPTDTLTAANGADSIVVLHLTILKPAVGTLTINGETSFCQGESTTLTASVAGNNGNMSYAWSNDATSESVTVSESGNLTVTATATLTANGVTCTATDNKTVTVTVNQPATGVDVQTACGEYTWINGVTYTESNYTATDTLNGSNGCDSIVTLNLTILSSTTGDTTASACEFFDWYGDHYTESGLYYHTLTEANADGCDSIVTLHLTIVNPIVGTLTIDGDNTICQGESTTLTASASDNDGEISFLWNYNNVTGNTITDSPSETTSYTVSATRTLVVNGAPCSATAEETVTVTVNQPTTGVDVQSACESFDWYEHYNITANCNNLTHTIIGGNANGCDSIVTLHLTVNHGTHNVETVTSCGSYSWYDSLYTESGTHVYKYKNAYNCPSADTLRLTVNHIATGVDVQTACGEFTWINGETYTESNYTATDTLSGSNGCDSIVTLNLTILSSTTGDTTAFACEFFDWYGDHYTESGLYYHTLTEANADGCDSIVTLHLTINNPVTVDTTIQVCNFPHTFRDRVYTEPTTDILTITTTDGSCDSVTYQISVVYLSSVSYDGYEYPIVKIGSDCWFAENLRAETGLNGASAFFEDESNVSLFGRLYTWYDAFGVTPSQDDLVPADDDELNGSKAISSKANSLLATTACPQGWTIPSVEDFENLKAAAGDNVINLKSPDNATWLQGMEGSTSGIGFNAPAGGLNNPATNRYERLLTAAEYWTAESADGTINSLEINYSCSDILFKYTPKNAKLSIRCIKIQE